MSSISFATIPAGLRHGRRAPVLPRRRSPATARCSAFRRGASDWEQHGGALVDENMAVLRRRIREADMAETNYEAPAGWAAWERRYYPAYVADVSGLVGALQLMLMNTRPSVAMAVLALVLFSVPVSVIAVLHHLELASQSVLQAMHVS